MNVRIIKECVWSFRKARRMKQTLEYMVGDVVGDLPEADAEQMVKGKYAEYVKDEVALTESYIEGKRIYPQAGHGQVVEVQTKDMPTKAVRTTAKTTNDNKSDKV